MSEVRGLQSLLIRSRGPHQPGSCCPDTLPGPIREFLRQFSDSPQNLIPAVAVPGSPGGSNPSAVGWTEVVAIIDAAAAWQELLVPSIAAARCESARLLVLVLPSETGSSRLDEVRHELQCHDIRTLAAGVRCIETPALLAELLTELLQDTRRPLMLFRSGSVAAAVAAVELLIRGLESGAEACERDAEWHLTIANAPMPQLPTEPSAISQKS